jgi:vancomycin resistance protein YoaR
MQSTIPAPHIYTVPERRSSADFIVLWFLIVVMIGVGLFAGWQFWHTDRIFTGVTVAGAPVGGMTRARAVDHLQQKLTPYPFPPVRVEYEGKQWILSSAQIAPQVDLMAAVNESYLVGRSEGGFSWITSQFQALLGLRNIQPVMRFDEGLVRQQVNQIAAEVQQPGRAAMQVGTLSLPAQAGVEVDVDTATRLVFNALEGQQVATISLPTQAVQPPDAAPVSPISSGQQVAWQPITLRHAESGLMMALDGATLAKVAPTADAAQLDEAALRAVVEGWAAQIAIPAQDARLRFNTATAQVEVIHASVVGRRLNVDETIEIIRQALATHQTQSPLPVEAVAPVVDSNRIAEMGIRELVASGSSYFKGSSQARMRNIEVATDKFVGVVIPPGGIFSFNKLVETVSAANGFEDSAIIWGDQTMVGVGGGVCQVSTTVFRAAMNAGFPIVERYNHGYVVSWYGAPGMDATIFTPTVDFKFRNDTKAYLLVQPSTDTINGVNTFNFYGTKPSRQVTISDPIITDVKDPGAPVYRVDESLAPGQKRQVEYAQRGMTVTVERTVTENGQTRVDKIISKYQPWNAVFLVGPGTDVAPAPTPAPPAPETSSAAPVEGAPETPSQEGASD